MRLNKNDRLIKRGLHRSAVLFHFISLTVWYRIQGRTWCRPEQQFRSCRRSFRSSVLHRIPGRIWNRRESRPRRQNIQQSRQQLLQERRQSDSCSVRTSVPSRHPRPCQRPYRPFRSDYWLRRGWLQPPDTWHTDPCYQVRPWRCAYQCSTPLLQAEKCFQSRNCKGSGPVPQASD